MIKYRLGTLKAVTSLFAISISTAAMAQSQQDAAPQPALAEIIVTAQRQSQSLQNVPIAVSAFSAKNLAQQQINSTSDLQLGLPNITFNRGNFARTASFNIRGIGDLCVGATCDSATAVHVNDMPVLGSSIAQAEYFDFERVEVLRGPQGTLYGRNATGGVINFITAKPDLSGFQTSADVEYGNYGSYRLKGMVNVPVSDTFGVRLAGYYLKRDGFTKNLYTGNRIDGRDQWDIRASFLYQPSSDTKILVVGHYFREKDNRSRIQKQLCHRDPTGILGCLPDKLAFENVNQNANVGALLTSRQFLSVVNPGLAPLALTDIYGADSYDGVVNPADFRTVRADYEPQFFSTEKQIQARLTQTFGHLTLNVSGGYTETANNGTTDYNLAVENSLAANPGLNTLAVALLPGAAFPGGVNPLAAFAPVARTLIPNGTGSLCQSSQDTTGVGIYGGNGVCAPTNLNYDTSADKARQWTVEAILTSKFDGPLNFLVGGNYLDNRVRDNIFAVNSFNLDYAAGVLGAGNSGGQLYLATPYYRNDSKYFHLKSYGLFGELTYAFSPKVKFTAGLRYNHDGKDYVARTVLLNWLAPFGSSNAYDSPFFQNYQGPLTSFVNFDADPAKPGNQAFAINTVAFNRLTGRAVLDIQLSKDNLLYASYSRGYKSGGINPPLEQIFNVPVNFAPESVNAFEIGSKNSLLNGKVRLNVTGFYYMYNNLQLSRIVARTSVNDNVDAHIYGLEAEALIKPARNVLINFGGSYLKTRISSERFLSNPQDPSGGRSDAVIIKDITNGSTCAITPNNGDAGVGQAVISAINQGIGASTGDPALLRPPVKVPGTNATGAFSICSAVQASLSNPPSGLSAAFGLPAGAALPLTFHSGGVGVNIKGNRLPQAPEFKLSAGIQVEAELGHGMKLVPRLDVTYTGGYYGSIFNGNVNKIDGYEIINAQVQLNGDKQRWYVRGFIQNLTNNNAVTGLFVSDASLGLFTNAFTLEPRRYGIAAGFQF